MGKAGVTDHSVNMEEEKTNFPALRIPSSPDKTPARLTEGAAATQGGEVPSSGRAAALQRPRLQPARGRTSSGDSKRGFLGGSRGGSLRVKNQVGACPSPRGDFSWPVPALPRRAPLPHRRPCLPPASGQAWLPSAPHADSRPPGWPWREGADPTSCLTLSGPAGVQWPGRRQGLSRPPPPPCPG